MPKKWDSDRTASDKLLTLFAILLFNDRAFSLKELTLRLNASKPSVSRLVTHLERSRIGSLRRETRGRESWYRLERPEVGRPVSLNPAGLSQLALCRDFLVGLLPEKMRLEMQAALSQATSLLPDDAEAPPANIGASINKGWIDYSPFEKIIDKLVFSIRAKKVCRVTYKAAYCQSEREYAFAPKRMLAHNECLYVDGWVLTEEIPPQMMHENSLRLAIQRFLDCKPTDMDAANFPDTPIPDNRDFGIMRGEPFILKAHFAPGAAMYVGERRWSQEQSLEELPDGSVVLTARMGDNPELLSWIISFGESVRILEPPWLIAKITQTLEKMLATHRAGNPGLSQGAV